MENKSGPKDKEVRDARRKEVMEFMRAVGPYSVPASMLAEKHGCSVQMIYKDRDYWIKQIKFKDISLEGKKIIMGLMKNMAITEELKAKGNVNERLRAIMASNSTAETFTRIMEQFGFKDKVAEKLDVVTGATFNLIERSIKEIKDAKIKNKGKRSGDQSKTSSDSKSSG